MILPNLILRHYIVMVIFALAMLSSSAAIADPISMADRYVPVNVQDSGDSSGRTLIATTDSFTTTVILSDEYAKLEYALLAAGCSKRPRVNISGRRLDITPVFRKEGALFRIPSIYLKPGSNEVVIIRDPEDAGKPWFGTTIFSLLDSTEEVHFRQVFTESRGPRVAPPTHSSQANFDVLHYDCTWEPNMTNASITSATVLIKGKVLVGPFSQVVLDFDDNGGAMAISNITGGTLNTWDTINKRIHIDLPASLAVNQQFTVGIGYSGTPEVGKPFADALNRETHGPSLRSVVYTFSEPYGARQWFPCKDLPDDKASSVSIKVIVPVATPAWEVVTNGNLLSKTTGAGKVTWAWSHNYPIATYLLSMCISDYEYVSETYTALDNVTTMAISHAIYPENNNPAGEADGAAGTLEVMEFFADQFGEYPFLTEKYYTASHNDPSGMEHQTCTSMPGGDVFDGMQRRNVHELAHHWFGNLITCTTFNDLWLNEGFATYCEALWDEFKFGKAAYHSRVNGWTVSTTQPAVGPNSDNFANSAVYRKGGWTLHMLRHKLGDTTFTQILNSWANHPTYRYSTAVTSDFRTLAESISGVSLTTFFNQWLTRPAFVGDPEMPTYKFNGNVSGTGPYTLNLTVDQTQSGTPYEMPVDVQMVELAGVTGTMVINNTASQSYSLDIGTSQVLEINLDPSNWVLNRTAVSIRTVGLPVGTNGVPYSRAMGAVGGSLPYTWSLQVGAPAWLSMTSGGTLSGTPPAIGTYSVPIRVQDNGGNFRLTTLSFHVLGTLPPNPPSGFSATAAGSQINLAWTDNSLDETAFEIQRSASPGGPYTVVITTAANTTAVTDTPPSIGTWYYVVRAVSSNGISANSNEANATISASPTVVINEIDYDQNTGVDAAEFVELYNYGASAINISGWKLELINGSTGTGVEYTTVTIPASTALPANGFYVLGCTGVSGADTIFASDTMQNGAADGVRLKDNSNNVRDAFLYEDGTTAFTYTGPSNSYEGDKYESADFATAPTGGQISGRGVSIGRYPDGADTNNNLVDFYMMPPTPDITNEGSISLPYSSDFSVLPTGTGIYGPFVTEAIVTLPQLTIPAGTGDLITPNSCIRIADKSFGGDDLFFGGPGNTGNLHVKGKWYLKSTLTGGMTWEASGITIKNTKASSFLGTSRTATGAAGYENGVSVVYYAGSATLQGIVTGQAGRVLVTHHVPGPVESDTNLANVVIAGNRWVPFEIFANFTAGTLHILVDNTSVYNSTMPVGMPTTGGVSIGYRQLGGIFGNDNGGFFDALTIDGLVPVSVSEFLTE